MKKISIVVLFYTILTLWLNYPLSIQITDSVRDAGDPLLNSWILAWDAHKILKDPFNLFNANIFYPHTRTLAYSEHLLGIAIFALPINLFFNNAILAYNIMFHLSFILSGLGMYLLAVRLTNNFFASFVAGLIFAFNPFRFSHFSHIQVLTAQWIPFTFLFFHRYIEKRRLSDILFFTLFFLLQSLSNSYYALFISVVIVITFIYYFITERNLLNTTTIKHILIFALITLIISYPLMVPYLKVKKEMGFERVIDDVIPFSADIVNYLAAPPVNKLYGKITSPFRKGDEGALLAGYISYLLALSGIFIFCLKKYRKDSAGKRDYIFYLILTALTFLLSLGPTIHFYGNKIAYGPYRILYRNISLFRGIRVPGRFAIFVIFGVSILVAYGIREIIRIWNIREVRLKILATIICLGLIVEFYSVPIPFKRIEVGKDVPEVYRWLGGQKESFSILELPMPETERWSWKIEPRYMYFSTYHYKNLINGFSGFFPPAYSLMAEQMADFPSDLTLSILKEFGVKYIILHAKAYDKKKLNEIALGIERQKEYLVQKAKFGEDYILELMGDRIKSEAVRDEGKYKELDYKKLSLDSNFNKEGLRYLTDGDVDSRWTTEALQRPGMYLNIDLGNIYKIGKMNFHQERSVKDIPREAKIEVSLDGISWKEIPVFFDRVKYLKSILVKKKDPIFEIHMEPVGVRFIKFILTKKSDSFYWSIHELSIYEVSS